MTRLPVPGKDIGTWGGILNDFLTTAHNPDGSLKSSALRILDGSITTPQLADNAVTDSKLDVATQTTLGMVASKYTKPAGGVPLTDLSSSLRANLTKAGTSVQQVNSKMPNGSGALTLTAADVGAATSLGGLSDVNATGATNSQVLSYNTGSSKWTAATVTSTTVNDASSTGKGILQLAGDLAGSNDPTNPTISTGAITDTKVATGAAIQQSKIQNLQTVLAAKAPLVSPTFSGTVTVPTPANPTDATTKGYVDGQVATGATPDASPTTKGKLQLAGDLAGTAASPTVAKLSGVSLAGLATGLLKNTTGTGVPSIATASDIPDLSGTYATATALTTESSTARAAEAKAVPRWAPTTTYTLGQQVVSPNNDVVSAIAGFTSGASYVPANWAVSSTYAPARVTLRGNRAVFIGDSVTSSQATDTPNVAWGISFPTYASYLSNGRLLRTRNAGVAGNRVADMTARFDTDVTPYAPSLVVIMGGTNDWNDAGPNTLTQYQIDVKALVAKVRAIGAQPIICTVPPNIISSARQGRTIIGNSWLRRYCQDQGIPLVDAYTLLVDPAAGGYLAAYLLDGTHPNNPGYAALGQYLYDTLAGFMNPAGALLPMENTDPNNLLTNGLNLTTTGSGTSLMPTGWSVQTSVHPSGVTGSLVTGDTTIKGNWWKVVADGTASGTNNEFITVSGIIPAHTYANVGRFKATGLRNADSGNGSGVLIGTAFNSVLNNGLYDFRVASTHYYDIAGGTYYQEVLAPSDASTALVRRQLLNVTLGSGTFQVAQTGFYDLTAMGLSS